MSKVREMSQTAKKINKCVSPQKFHELPRKSIDFLGVGIFRGQKCGKFHELPRKFITIFKGGTERGGGREPERSRLTSLYHVPACEDLPERIRVTH